MHILKMTLPQKNGHRIKTPSIKLTILVSSCWEKKFIRNNAHNFFILSLVFLKLLIVSVAFFLGHPVFLREKKNLTNWIIIPLVFVSIVNMAVDRIKQRLSWCYFEKRIMSLAYSCRNIVKLKQIIGTDAGMTHLYFPEAVSPLNNVSLPFN